MEVIESSKTLSPIEWTQSLSLFTVSNHSQLGDMWETLTAYLNKQLVSGVPELNTLTRVVVGHRQPVSSSLTVTPGERRLPPQSSW